MSDIQTLIDANTAFYRAITSADVEAMTQLWAQDDAVSCIHPGWPAIVGHTAVLGSWRDILRNPGGLRIICHEPHALATGNEGRVLCVEIVGTVALAASNHFRRIAGAWKMVHHQASQIIPQQDPTPDPARQVH